MKCSYLAKNAGMVIQVILGREVYCTDEKLQLNPFRNAQKTIQKERDLHSCPDVLFYYLKC